MGNFGQLLHAVSKDPAMLIYLDNVVNNKERPNENFARELLELFTLGEGNYGEQDVREAARAFTGWKVRRRKAEFRFVRSQHDFGSKTFLGRRGWLNGDDIVHRLLQHPRTAMTITAKLWKEFVSLTPNERRLETLANIFRRSNYEIKPVLKAIFLSPEFVGRSNYGTLIKSPVELTVGVIRQLQINVHDLAPIARYSRRLGQDILDPPNNPRQFFRQSRRLKLPEVSTGNPALAHILSTQQRIYEFAIALRKYLARAPEIEKNFPKHQFGKQLQLAAAFILPGAPVTTIKVSLGGFDTHNNQRQKHDGLLSQLAQCLAALRSTLVQHGQWRNTLIMTYSEFGRRAGENDSKGTDHGTSAPHMLLGGSVKGGFYGKQPSLKRLDNKNLVHHIDFRQLYSTVNQDWWRLKSNNPFARYPSIRCLQS